MAGLNLLVAAIFFVCYIFYRNADGTKSALILVAASVGLLASILSFVAYSVFTKKFENAQKR